MQNILDAILAGDTTPEEYANLALPDSYRAVTVHKDEVDMFAGLPSQRKDPRESLHLDDVPSGDYVQVTGTAMIIDGDAVREPTLELCRKYMAAEAVEAHWDSLVAEGPRVIIEVHPERFQWHDR